MTAQGKAPEKKRRDWIIVLIILLFGLLCVIVAGGWAIRFAPTWKLNTNMGSNIDPNSNFQSNRPNNFLEPIDPAILTQPVWLNVFLTPGASSQIDTPAPLLPTNTPPATNTTAPTAVISPTFTVTAILPSPTNTVIYYPPPPPTNTKKPPPPPPPSPTNTPVVPADLSITKDDGSTFYVAGSTSTYTITVTNNGPNNVTGAIVTDNKPAQVTTWSWACTSQNGGANGCDAVANSGANFSDSVNLPNGASIVYTVTANISAGASVNLVNTATVSVPAGYFDTTPGNNSATDTDTPTLTADLQITKTDNDTDYVANALKTYTITVSNVGPSNVTGATVTDIFSTNTNISGAAWGCLGTGGATCTLVGVGDINDTVDLPAGSYVTYTVGVNVSASPSGNLVNTATVTEPAGVTDPTPGNNSAMDTDQLIVASSFPYGGIGTTKDCPNPACQESIPAGTYVTLQFGTPLVVGVGNYLVYYEYPEGTNPGILMDAVIVQIGDGSNWYTILNWGDGVPDTNTNVSLPLLVSNPTGDCAGEPDNCEIDASLLFNSTGIIINVDGVVPNGTYPYIRIFSPPSAPGGPDTDGKIEVDAIQILP